MLASFRSQSANNDYNIRLPIEADLSIALRPSQTELRESDVLTGRSSKSIAKISRPPKIT